MAALWNRVGHYIFALWFLLSSSSFSFPCLISAVTDCMSTILLHMMWPYSANLECRSEMCCTRLAGNAGPQKSPKNHHLGTIVQIWRAIIFATKAHMDNGKIVEQQYSLQMSSQYGELRPSSGWDRSGILSTLANFKGFCVFAALLHGTLVVGVSHTAALNRGQVMSTKRLTACQLKVYLPHGTFKIKQSYETIMYRPMPNVMVALPNRGGAICSTP